MAILTLSTHRRNWVLMMSLKLLTLIDFRLKCLTERTYSSKLKKINITNYGKCYYYVLQFKHYSGVYLNGKIHIIYCPFQNEYFVFGEYVSDISTKGKYLLITNNCRGNISYDRLLYSKEQSRFFLECE